MSIDTPFQKLKLNDDGDNQNYEYINVFKNPNKLPIHQIHLERSWRQLRKDLPKDFDFLTCSSSDLEKGYFEKRTELLPALNKLWVPKGVLPKFQPYFFTEGKEENMGFILNNIAYIEGLEYLLNCNYHQFWCVILFEPSAAIALRSFLLNPILPFQVKYLEDESLEVYKTIFNKFLLVYEKLLTFEQSQFEYMPEAFGLSKLISKKLLNLPIVITIAFLYKENNLSFVNKVTNMYFTDTSQVEFVIKELETLVDQNLIILEMLGGHLCGFDDSAVIVPISIENRPPVFNLNWVYSVVSYLVVTVMTSNVLFHFYKPALEIALDKNFPFRLPFIYVTVYKQLYELLNEREEAQTQEDLFKRVIEEINLGRSEFVELYHTFASYCLDEALKHMGDTTKQESIVETYLKLLTVALEDDYFICDYNATYNVATQNEMFQSCCDIDSTRTEFIISCINKLPRHKKLQELSKLKRQTVENVFRDFAPAVAEEPEEPEAQPGPSRDAHGNGDVEENIGSIMDMFPHLGDGFILQCLETYNFSSSDVINAILENNLPPHLSEIPFNQIRIPPEPEPEKPVLAYVGKKPGYDDALKLLNDKKEKNEIKNLILEGVQYDYDRMYDDEYDDRYDNEVAILVPDNPLKEEVFNPNRRNKYRESSDEEEEEDEKTANGQASERNKNNFCEDPAVLRERREAAFRSKNSRSGGGSSTSSQPRPKADVVGKPKGQGQEKSTLINRQKKNVNKSSGANHNRKGGAQFKRNRGMIPF